MIYATLVKINRTPDELPKVELIDYTTSNFATGSLVRPINTEWEFTILKKRTFENEIDAQESLSELLSAPAFKNNPLSIGLFIHKTPAMQSLQHLKLLHCNEQKRLVATNVYNPLWNEIKKPVMRNVVSTNLMSAQNSPAMQSLLFAMIDIFSADHEWLKTFKLKDPQAETLYQWERENLNQVVNITPINMTEMMQNVLSVYRLPWIGLKFIDTGNSCSFSVKTTKGELLSSPDGEEPEGAWDWLHTISEKNFARAKDVYQGCISIQKMDLTFVLSWGLTYEILLHELAHYIAFVLDTPYRLNMGKVPLSFNEYKDIFSGHGALYIGIFVFLLSKFLHYKADELYSSLDSADLKYVVVKQLSVNGITQAIAEYVGHSTAHQNTNFKHAIK